ncbi:MAG: hypothetical protein IKC64_06245 [Clostridia bacterium]|nr:hypothetical protein [Clostridia bacterium]
MTIKSAIYTSAMFLQLDQVCLALDENGEIDEDTQREIDLLLRCANLVLSEISCAYYPLKTTQKVRAKGRYIHYRDLEKPLVDIYSIKSSSGESVRFSEYYDRIFVYGESDGEFEIEYSYPCPSLALDDEIPYQSERVSERILSYGTVCEYYVVSGMTSEASVWQKRYYNALEQSKSRREKRVKTRRWA